MNRDGENLSPWQREAKFSPASVLNKNHCYDVIVVGGGVTGVTTAHELQKQGKTCLLLEARNLCFGTSGGTTSHLNSFFDSTYAEVASDFGKEGARNLANAAKDALTLYQKNIDELHIECGYLKTNGLVYAKNEKQVKELAAMYDAALEAGVAVTYEAELPIKDSSIKVLSFPNQARIHPVKYVHALAHAYEKNGGVILESCSVSELNQKEKLEVQTSLGTLQCEKLIYATHIPPGVNLLHLRCAPYRSYVMGIELESDKYPDALVYDMMEPYHYYRTQEIDTKKILIAGGEDHKTGHEENTELPFERLEEYLKKIFQIKEVKFKWSSQYFEPADGLAYIGHLPGNSENVFVATGFGGNGMIYSHVAARVLTEKIVSNTEAYGNLFNPGRVKPVAGFKSFVSENADVVSSLITDRFKMPSIESLSGIPNNSGQTVKYEHQHIAVYKDGNGQAFILNPTCTHLKCSVIWNQTERSWDCPCHGARYSVNGEVLTGPSIKELEKIEI